MVMDTTTHSNFIRSPLPTLPTELWLQILEHTTIHEAEHLWTSVRITSRQFRDYVERLFITTYLPHFAISLSLPRRDATSGALKWTSIIQNASIIMSFEAVISEGQIASFASPVELKNGEETMTLEELRASNVLPQARLLEAPAWVYANKNYMTGRPLQLPMDIEWDEGRKRWVWQLEWKRLITRFYRAKMQARMQVKKPSQTRSQKGPGWRR